MKHRISRRAFLRGCTLLAASAAVGSLTSCGGTNAKDSGLPQIIVGSDTYPPYIYLNNDGVPAGIDVEIATEAFRRRKSGCRRQQMPPAACSRAEMHGVRFCVSFGLFVLLFYCIHCSVVLL